MGIKQSFCAFTVSIKETLKAILNFFITKDGKKSKSAFFLSAATFISFTLWFIQSLFAGMTLWGYVVPEFNHIATIGMLVAVSSLYLVNHKVRASASRDEVTVDTTGGGNE